MLSDAERDALKRLSYDERNAAGHCALGSCLCVLGPVVYVNDLNGALYCADAAERLTVVTYSGLPRTFTRRDTTIPPGERDESAPHD